MLKNLKPVLLGCLALAIATPAVAQVKQTPEQMTFYTSQWKGERFPDGRPKVPDNLLKRVVDVSIEDLWDYLRDKGFNCPVRHRLSRCCIPKSPSPGGR